MTGLSRGGDSGSGTVLVLAAGAVLLAASVVIVSMVAAVAVHRRAVAAADLAAIAAAAHPGAECEYASGIASAHEMRLDGCEIDGEDVRVSVSAALPGVLGLLAGDDHRAVRIRAKARAGPDRSPRSAMR